MKLEISFLSTKSLITLGLKKFKYSDVITFLGVCFSFNFALNTLEQSSVKKINTHKYYDIKFDYEMVNNYDFIKDMSYLDFLKEVGINLNM